MNRWLKIQKIKLQGYLMKWLGVNELYIRTGHHARNIHRIGREVREAVKIIKDRTDIHVDAHCMTPSTIITIGKFKKRTYFQCYNMHDRTFEALVCQLKDMQKYGNIHTIDAPMAMEQVFKYELQEY